MPEQELAQIEEGVLHVLQAARAIAELVDTATIYHCLGIDPHTETRDQTGRPFAVSPGTPIAELVGS